jgi:small nuclear ribonucleoprotein (snRNP)-like protein
VVENGKKLEKMKKPKEKDPLLKMLNKQIEIETTENQKYIGTLEDFDKFSIALQYKKSENPLVFQIIAIEKFKIKSIHLKTIKIGAETPFKSAILRKMG